MTKRRLKKSVVYALYGVLFVSVFGVIFSIESATSPSLKEPDFKFEKVSEKRQVLEGLGLTLRVVFMWQKFKNSRYFLRTVQGQAR